MTRNLTIAAAQSGPIGHDTPRTTVVDHLIDQMREAHALGADLIVYTECALTAFFVHWWIEDDDELNSWFEPSMPSPITQPLFDEARRLQIGFSLGYCELERDGDRTRRFNSSILVDKQGAIVGKHRKIHLPGHVEHRPNNPFQNLEKRYFEVGDTGFQTFDAFGGRMGLAICNDRRWSESYRLLGLAGAEVILIGYNTPDHIPEFPERDRQVRFHHELCMQAGANENGSWVIAVGKAGVEEGVSQIGYTSIISPTGEIVAQSTTSEAELVIHTCDLDLATRAKSFLNLQQNRQPAAYGPLTLPTELTLPTD